MKSACGREFTSQITFCMTLNPEDMVAGFKSKNQGMQCNLFNSLNNTGQSGSFQKYIDIIQ